MEYKLDLINIIDNFKHKLTDNEYKTAVETLQKIDLESHKIDLESQNIAVIDIIQRIEHINYIRRMQYNADIQNITSDKEFVVVKYCLFLLCVINFILSTGLSQFLWSMNVFMSFLELFKN